MIKQKLAAAVSAAIALSGAGRAQAPQLPVPPTVIGVNVSKATYYARARGFANLALGSAWGSSMPAFKDKELGPEYLDKDGNPKSLPGGQSLVRMMNQPNAPADRADIRCTWQGKGKIEPTLIEPQEIRRDRNGFTFRWDRDGPRGRGSVLLVLKEMDSADPVRSLDCREVNIPADARFDPAFIAYLKPFKVLRFMDWQNTNANLPVDWAKRHTLQSQSVVGQDGVAIEDMVALSSEIGADPWFTVPWKADDDYVRRFAQLVHQTLPPNRTVYVEVGNEVWNWFFPVAQQAKAEGLAAGLSTDPGEALLFRYAQRTAQVMDIWSKVFADRPDKLVRVAACQNGDGCPKKVLGFRDTAAHVDAVATAPYFGHDFGKYPPASVDDAFQRLGPMIDETLQKAADAKAVAAKYGKPYIAYEGGQHIVIENLDLATKIQRDPRMAAAYKHYLDGWRTKIGGTLALYSSAGPVGRYGSWGLVEYLGQPLAETPKLRAVQEAIGRKGAGGIR